MTLEKGTKFGRYEIVSMIGAGGMGEVYLARDPKIGREVAIKVLPKAFSGDKERLARFEQEAQAAGSLNHPNILSIYDVDTEGEVTYVVSELLKGETLRDHLGNSPLPIRKALDYALQTARGLAAAHEKGIIHRDIKPENLFVTTDGRLKILDFGLAKLTEGNGEAAGTDLPTRKINTSAGAVMGTVGYMSPEQLRGAPVDPRTDIFSFGTVLYEMLAGRRAFNKDSTADTISAILREDPPDLSETNGSVDQGLERVVRRCLEKQREQRFHSASDLAFALDSLMTNSGSGDVTRTVRQTASGSVEPRSASYSWVGWAVAGLLLVGLAGIAWWGWPQTPSAPQAMRFNIFAPPKVPLGDSIVISPDGRMLAFTAASQSGEPAVFVRPLDALEAKQLPGTEGAVFPFWSPDSRSLAFFAGGKLKKIDASGGPTQTITDAPGDVRGGAWAPDGTILFAPGITSPLFRVPASGGTAVSYTVLDEERVQTSHRFPTFLPDGRHFLYFGRSPQKKDAEGIFVGSLDSPDTKYIMHTEIRGEYAPTGDGGMLLFVRDRSLMAQQFDPDKLELSGEPVSVAEGVLSFPTEVGPTAHGAFSASTKGHLVFRPGGTQTTQLTWFDRAGREQDAISPPAIYHEPQVSPDGKRVLVGREEGGMQDIMMVDPSRGSLTRLTFDPGVEASPAWSPDGSRFAYSSTKTGAFTIHQKLASGAGAEEMIAQLPGDAFPDSWSPDGKYLLVEANYGAERKFDLMVVPVNGEAPYPYLSTNFQETHSQFSPDGRFVAYVSDETGRAEVYVQNFPATGGKWQISTSGGDQPQWRADGKELFYMAPDRNLMAVPIISSESGFEAGKPEVLFLTNAPIYGITDDKNTYFPDRDGSRFLFCKLVDQSTIDPLVLILNWSSDLKK